MSRIVVRTLDSSRWFPPAEFLLPAFLSFHLSFSSFILFLFPLLFIVPFWPFPLVRSPPHHLKKPIKSTFSLTFYHILSAIRFYQRQVNSFNNRWIHAASIALYSYIVIIIDVLTYYASAISFCRSLSSSMPFVCHDGVLHAEIVCWHWFDRLVDRSGKSLITVHNAFYLESYFSISVSPMVSVTANHHMDPGSRHSTGYVFFTFKSLTLINSTLHASSLSLLLQFVFITLFFFI